MISRRFSLYKGEMPFEQEIDLRHPWVQAGMLAFWSINEGGGNGIYDALNGLKLVPTSFPPIGPWNNTEQGIDFSGTFAYVFAVTPPYLFLQPPVTFAVGIKIHSAPSGTVYLITTNNNNLGLQLTSGPAGRATWSTAGFAATATMTTNARHVVATTFTPTNANLYHDGIPAGVSTTGTISAGSYSGSSRVISGLDAGFVGNFVLDWAAIWNQALPASMHAEIGANPNAIRQIYRHRRRRTVFAASTIGGGSATLSAATGVFGFSGNAANLLAGRVLGASPGSYGLTGQAAALLSGRVLPAATGVYALTGIDAGLLTGHVLTASTGVFTLIGNDAALLSGRVIAASTGVYVLTGNAANLVFSGQPGAYTLVAETGSFSLTGNDAALLAGRVLMAAPGSFALSSVGASLTWSGHITPSFIDPDEVTIITP